MKVSPCRYLIRRRLLRQKIAACELFLRQLHFREFRVRYHGDLARIELAQQEINRFFDS